MFNHLATVGEGIGALGWVTIEGAESPKYVGEMKDASLFYGNRVVREYKDRYLSKMYVLIVAARQSTKNGRLHSQIS